MSHAFISYAHDDSLFALKLNYELSRCGYETWIDTQGLAGGVEWEKGIMNAIDASTCFIVVWSANIESSVFSRKELQQAINGGKHVIPILISGDEKRRWSEVETLQYIDFRSDFDTAFTKLREALRVQNVQATHSGEPDLRETINHGGMTFKAASQIWRLPLHYERPSTPIPKRFIALPIESSITGVNTYLVGGESAKIAPHDPVQVFFNFSGPVAEDRFSGYLDYLIASDKPVWTVLVRGPITTDKRFGSLNYTLPYDPAVWKAAVKLAWQALGKTSDDRTPIHLFINAPVAIAAGFVLFTPLRRNVEVFQINLEAKDANNRYFEPFA